MHFTKERRFGVKMGDYETYTFGATYGLNNKDLGYSDDEWAALPEEKREAEMERLKKLVNEGLADELIDELRDAAALTDNTRSFILRDLPDPEPEEPPEPAPTKIVRRIRRP